MGIWNVSRSNVPFRLDTNLQSTALLSRPLVNLHFSLSEESLKKGHGRLKKQKTVCLIRHIIIKNIQMLARQLVLVYS